MFNPDLFLINVDDEESLNMVPAFVDLFPNAEKLEFPFPKKKKLKYTVNDLLEKNVSSDYKITKIARNNIETHLKKDKKLNLDSPLIANEIRRSRCNFRQDGVSPCLTAKMGTGGNNIPVLVNEMRKLTERECLRIMGFPDSYKIKANFHQSYKQIGNSVVVPIISDIAEELVKIIKKEGI